MIRGRKEFKILLADDDEDDRILVRDALAEQPAEDPIRPVKLMCVVDGVELMDYLFCRGKFNLRDHPRPDLILLDLNMPGKDGRRALQEIKADPILRAIPVIVLTTSSERREIAECYRLGANSYVIKPASFEALTQKLKDFHTYWETTCILPVVEPLDNCLGKNSP